MTSRELIAIALVPVALLALLARLRRRAPRPLVPESLYAVSFDDTAIRVAAPDGEVMSVAWDDLVKVGIRTTDEGPLSPDVFWGLHASTRPEPVVFPGGASGESELLSELGRRLAGFRHEQVIEAMGSTSNRYFVAWERR
jgi:hypothetical protein